MIAGRIKYDPHYRDNGECVQGGKEDNEKRGMNHIGKPLDMEAQELMEKIRRYLLP